MFIYPLICEASPNDYPVMYKKGMVRRPHLVSFRIIFIANQQKLEIIGEYNKGKSIRPLEEILVLTNLYGYLEILIRSLCPLDSTMSGGHAFNSCLQPIFQSRQKGCKRDRKKARVHDLVHTANFVVAFFNFCMPVVTNKSAVKCAEKLNDRLPKKRKRTSRSFYILQTLYISFKVIWFKVCGLFKLHLMHVKS